MNAEPLVSEIRVNWLHYAAVITDQNGEQPAINYGQWTRDMHTALKLLVLLDRQPRQMVIVHPAGYAQV